MRARKKQDPFPMVTEEQAEQIGAGLRRIGMDLLSSLVFTTLLCLNRATLMRIARKAKLNHAITLWKLQDLMATGLVHESQVKNHKFYFPIDPRHGFRRYMEHQKHQRTHGEEALIQAMSGFEIVYRDYDVPESHDLKCLEGGEDYSAFYAELKKTRFDNIYEFTNVPILIQRAHTILKEKNAKVLLQKRHYHVILSPLEVKDLFKHGSSKRIRWTQIPERNRTLSGNYYLGMTGNKVFLMSPTVFADHEPMILMIRDASIAQTAKKLLELSLIGVKRLERKAQKKKEREQSKSI